jgi:hypothetical protein
MNKISSLNHAMGFLKSRIIILCGTLKAFHDDCPMYTYYQLRDWFGLKVNIPLDAFVAICNVLDINIFLVKSSHDDRVNCNSLSSFEIIEKLRSFTTLGKEKFRKAIGFSSGTWHRLKLGTYEPKLSKFFQCVRLSGAGMYLEDEEALHDQMVELNQLLESHRLLMYKFSKLKSIALQYTEGNGSLDEFILEKMSGDGNEYYLNIIKNHYKDKI